MKHEETYTSVLHTHVHFVVYEPKIVLRLRAVIFIHHDVGEDLRRYDHLALWLSNRGYVVVVSDTAGHGRSLIDLEQGYFGEGDALAGLLDDMHHLQQVILPRYPDAIHFYIGVGFGASLVRLYATRYSAYFHGMILISPAYNFNLTAFEEIRLRIERFRKGSRYHAQRLTEAMRRHWSRHLGKNPLSWMSRDEKVLKNFENDPMVNFAYTIKGYMDLLKINHLANHESTIKATPDDLPILIMSGKEDPITRFGRDGEQISEAYKNKGTQDLTLKIYEGRRHAILRDKDKLEIYTDMVKWLDDHSYY